MDSASRRPVNRLAREKSPYLLQHQFNPVDWFPWGEEAFAKARREDKPILLSIGYSTCHWCHVMERESFEDPEVGDYLRDHFVSIKVDREERPDVDKIYMTFVQAMTGAGGWPLNVFLSPDLRPFYGGTYFPPEPRHGRPGFLQLLERIHEVWTQQREQVLTSSNNLVQLLEQRLGSEAPSQEDPTADLLVAAAAGFMLEYDPVHGGFGGAPKFPRPSVPQFLLRHSIRSGDSAGVQAVLHTCECMAAGGMHDQLGGGFARYSVDAEWLVPHFEKMLYDNAQLLHLYLDAHLVSGAAVFAEVARGIVSYIRRDMTHPGGGFYSAEDADSEGQEGKFYCWTLEELAQCLSAAERAIAVRYFGLTSRGNFVDHSHPDPLPKLNVLHVADPALADPEKPVLASAITKMQAVRGRRVRPHLDDKVLSSWNGMMLGALARAAVILDDAAMREAAFRNQAAVQRDLWDASTKTLFHRWREGEHDQVQLLEAYAQLLGGVLDLYETTLESDHLQFACDLATAMIERFYDREAGGFWQALPNAQDLILRVKDEYDGAEPSGNAVAILSLLRLSAMTGRTDWEDIARRGLRFFRRSLERLPAAVPHLLQALDWASHPPCRVVISGSPEDPRTRSLLRAAHGVYHPGRVVLGVQGVVDETARTIAGGAGEPRAFVCVGSACQLPTADGHELQEHLRRAMPALGN